MKNIKILLVILILIISPIIQAERVDFSIGKNYFKDGRNVTILDLTKDKALICINDDISIFSRSKEKTINRVKIEIRKIEGTRIEADIRVDCKNCKCDESCSNLKCFPEEEETKEISEFNEEDTIELNKIKTNSEDEKPAVNEGIEIIENSSINIASLVGAFLIIIILIAGFYYLIKKKY